MMSATPRRDTAWQSAELAQNYLAGVRGAIPLAATQLEVMLRVLRAFQPQPRRWLDVGCGDGILGRALLQEFPQADGTFVDFSPPMLQAARDKVGPHPQVEFVPADFGLTSWIDTVQARAPFDAIVSGFAIHHQPDNRKQELYGEIFDLLSPGGVFLNLEHVASGDRQGEQLFEDLFIDALYAYSQAEGKSASREEVAQEYYYRPDKAANILTSVELQCEWLRQIGLIHVDCYFKLFELALFGGVRPIPSSEVTV
jgi:SAM-dependent methyltransferase